MCFIFRGEIISNSLNINDPNSINENLDKSVDTWIFVPGYRTGINDNGTIGSFAKAVSLSGANIIMVNWTEWSFDFYPCIVKFHVEKVGRFVNIISNRLKAEGFSQEKIVYAGHSLGAHVVGIASRNLQRSIKRCLCMKMIISGDCC